MWEAVHSTSIGTKPKTLPAAEGGFFARRAIWDGKRFKKAGDITLLH